MNVPYSAGPRAKSAKQLGDEFDSLVLEAQAILDDAPAGELTGAAMSRFDDLVGAENGLIAKKKVEIENREKVDAGRARLALEIQNNRTSEEKMVMATGGMIDSSLSQSSGTNVTHKIGRLSAFGNTEQGARDAYASGMWLRAISARCNKNTPLDERAEQFLDSHGLGIQAAQTENTSTAGGYLAPEPLSNAIISIRERVGVARRIADVVPMTSDTLSIGKRNGGLRRAADRNLPKSSISLDCE